MSKDTIGLRRRLVTLGLGLTPGDLRIGVGLHPVRVSNILAGRSGLTPDQAAVLSRLTARRVRELFAK